MRADIFGSAQLNYKLVLNVIGIAVFAALWWVTQRRGVTDPMCGMRVDRAHAVTRTSGSRTVSFCSEACAETWDRAQVAAVSTSPATAPAPPASSVPPTA